jgi:hypothetical protein
LPWGWKPNAIAYVNDHPTSISYANGDSNSNSNHHTTSISYANSDGDNQANTDATPAAYAISSSDAVSEWAKRFKIVIK